MNQPSSRAPGRPPEMLSAVYLNVVVPAATLKSLDEIRGDLSRSRYVRDMLARELAGARGTQRVVHGRPTSYRKSGTSKKRV